MVSISPQGHDSPYRQSPSPSNDLSPGRELAMKELALRIPTLKALTHYKNRGNDRSELKQMREVHKQLKKGEMSIVQDNTERRILAAVVLPQTKKQGTTSDLDQDSPLKNHLTALSIN